jgi:uncharacterized protein YbjT (DUF2867 family)
MFTILGATGNVGSKIVDILVKKGNKVRMVAPNADQLRPFVSKNAQAFAGDALNTEFLTRAFEGSDAVFTMIPTNLHTSNYVGYATKMGDSIASALKAAKVKYVVNLSSVGADLAEGTGPIVGLHYLEECLNQVEGLNVVHLRTGPFMEHLLANIDTIKSTGVCSSAYRGDLKFPLTATRDVAAFAADRLVNCDFSGSSVRYLLGQRDISMTECTGSIGRKINKPNLIYTMFSHDESEKWLRSIGMSSDLSRLYTELYKACNNGRIYGAVTRAPENTTPTSFEQFCDEVFVPAYREVKAA